METSESDRTTAVTASTTSRKRVHEEGGAENDKKKCTPTTVDSISLYRDVILAVYQFLELKELIPASLISRSFYSAGLTLKPRAIRQLIRNSNQLVNFLHSPFCVHVNHLYLSEAAPTEFNLLAGHMSHLKILETYLSINTADLQLPITFPSYLSKLCVTFRFNDEIKKFARDAFLEAWTKKLTASASQLTTIDIGITNYRIIKAPCLKLLATIPTLVDLTIPSFAHGSDPDTTESETNEIVRQLQLMSMHQLTRLSAGSWSATQLSLLVDCTEELTLEDIGFTLNLDEATAEPLLSLTHLTKLTHSDGCVLEDPVILFPQLANLTHLVLGCYKTVNILYLVEALTSCTKLKLLQLQHEELVDEHLQEFLPELPELETLRFVRSPLTTLNFCSSVTHLAQHLKSFVLIQCKQLPLAQLSQIQTKLKLHQLVIDQSFTESIDEATLATMWPSSNEFRQDLWPNLQEFIYIPRHY